MSKVYSGKNDKKRKETTMKTIIALSLTAAEAAALAEAAREARQAAEWAMEEVAEREGMGSEAWGALEWRRRALEGAWRQLETALRERKGGRA